MEDGDIDAWLKRISWDTLSEWLTYMDEEPIGEERADLRMEALASVIWNVNVSSKEIGGVIEPQRYVSGFNRDRVCVLMLKPKEEDTADKLGTSEDRTVNNPVVWRNFTTNLLKAYGGGRRK